MYRSNQVTTHKTAAARHGQSFFEYVPEPLLITDLNGKIQQVNHAATQLLGRPHSALLGQPFTILVPQKERQTFRARLAKLDGADQGPEWTQPLLRTNGVAFDAQLRVGIVRETNGKPAALCWSVHPASVQKAAELEAKYSFLSSAARQLHTTLDLDALATKVVRLAVPAFADLCVLRLRDGQGQIVQTQIAHRDPDKQRELVAKERQYWTSASDTAAQNPAGADTRKLVPHVSDELQKEIVYADEHLRALSDLNLKSYISMPLRAHGQALGTIVFAITDSDRVYAQHDLEQAEDLARQAAIALENARAFAEAQAALHAREAAIVRSWQEARLPLNILVNSLQVLKRQAEDLSHSDGENGHSARVVIEQATWSANLQHIEQAVDRLNNLVSMITELAQLQNGSVQSRPAWLNLSQVVYSVAEDLRIQLKAGSYARDLRLETDIAASASVWVKADRGQIERVVTNVIDNALKYSLPGGRVQVSLTVEETPEQGDEPVAHLTVSDQGIGVPPDEQARVLEPFSRGSNTLGKNLAGIGIGLTISREIVERHGGKIWIESDGIGKGTTVHIVLPHAELPQE